MSTAAGNVAVHLGADSVSVTSTESVFQALDGNVPDALKQKIINGEYIDLGQLLQRRPGPDKSRCLTIEDGHLVVQSKPFTMKITDINHWTDAFLIFASIFPLHILRVVKAHQKFLSILESPKVLCLALYCFYYILTTYRRTYTHRSDFLQMTRQSILLSIITLTRIPFSKTLTPYKHGNACGTWILIRVSVKCYTFPNPGIQLSTYTCYMDRYLKPWTTPST